MIAALVHYGQTIKKDGWQAGEALIRRYSKRFADFEKMANATAIMLRTQEILQEEKH